MDVTELSRLVENLIRIGTIHSVDHAAVRVRVQTGALITQWLPWFERRAGETTIWNPPTVGEQCIVFSPSGEPASGVVLVGIHSELIQPPSHSPEIHVTKYPDGAVVSYNHAASALVVTGIKTANIVASESITLDTPLTHCTGTLTVDDLMTYKNGLRGSGGTAGNGNAVTGDFIHHDGELSSEGVVLATHRHSGVYAGEEISGVPV